MSPRGHRRKAVIVTIETRKVWTWVVATDMLRSEFRRFRMLCQKSERENNQG